MTISKYKILFVFLITALSVWVLYNIFSSASPDEIGFRTSSQVYDHNYYFELYDIEVLERTDAEIEYPFWVAPNPEQNITDLNHRVETLPYSQDKNRYWYVVYPKHGLTVPLDTPSMSDINKIQSGQAFNHYPYLEDGALHYRGSSPMEWNGNMVIAAHSSFGKSEPWRYKTAFQVLPISRAGEHIFVYIQNNSWSYDMYDYVIESSFRSDIHNTAVLAQPTDKKQLTTYGCYVIWSNAERWINQAILVSTFSDISLSTSTSIQNEYNQWIQQPILKEVPLGWHAVAQESKPEVFIHQVPDKFLPTIDELIGIIKQRIGTDEQIDITVQYRLNKKIQEYGSHTSDGAKLRTEILKYIQRKLYPNTTQQTQ